MLATQYAHDFGIEAQKEDESDSAFRQRVAGNLREQGHLIEAHEVQANSRHDGDGNAMIGIMGALAMALSGRDYGSRGERLVGDEIAVGTIVQHDISPAGEAERRSDALLAEMLMAGMSPDVIRSLHPKR